MVSMPMPLCSMSKMQNSAPAAARISGIPGLKNSKAMMPSAVSPRRNFSRTGFPCMPRSSALSPIRHGHADALRRRRELAQRLVVEQDAERFALDAKPPFDLARQHHAPAGLDRRRGADAFREPFDISDECRRSGKRSRV